ncbi:MAG: glutathione peroxidase [Gammaproteobacteria bacterium]|nr:glutathione peroxidase [Gammaproteobacteria bacterium]MBT8151194.1 glutathione peroxidase [Gammaproteobacteria bacterium]NNM11409.1 glutathione peroxidase [Pseudomonadales bacterium]RZV54741.1 MAG: glutathione peroxidase [Pseudomonadales bacterium]
MFEVSMRKLHSQRQIDLCDLTQKKPVLIVNTASHCGFTPQFRGLEKLHLRYKDRGLVVIGFSSNDFNQEASKEAKAATVCYVNYGVTFTMLAPSHVKGPSANPVFVSLRAASQEPGWNFNKYLVGREGKKIEHYESRVAPNDAELIKAIESLL